MNTELAMNAYVLLGNALHWLVNGKGVPAESGFNAAAVRELYSGLEPQPPARIVEAVATMTAEERKLLGDVCRYVQRETASEAGGVLGLPDDVVQETLVELGL